MSERAELRQALVIALEQAREAFDHAETKDDHMLCEMRYRTFETALVGLNDPAQIVPDREKLVEYYDGEIARVTGLYFDALNEIKVLKAPAQRLPIQADIKQIISEGWRNGKSSAEVAAEILREFDMPAQGALGARDNDERNP
jgi:hypothetical protein